MLQVGIAGMGWWGKTITRMLSGSDKVRVRAAFEPQLSPELSALAGSYDVALYSSFAALLDDPSLAAVILTTPHSLHAQQMIACAEAGKHVFVEKPLALTLADARAALDACARAGVIVGIGHERRFEPPVIALAAAARDGRLGTLMQIEANFSHDKFVGMAPGNWRLSPEQAPAGGMTATGIHMLDMAVSILGPALRVHAENHRCATDLPSGDSLAVLLRFARGASATINVMLATPFISRFAIYGSGGWMEVRDKSHLEEPQGWWLTRCFKGAAVEVIDYPAATPVRDNLEAFAAAVTGAAAYPIARGEMLGTIAALEAIFRSARTNETVDVAAIA